MNNPMFVVPLAFQEAEIKEYCFGKCGKANIGRMITDLEIGDMSNCFEVKCPFEFATIEDPLGMVDGHMVYLRKLVPNGQEIK